MTEQARFAHASEAELARILDYYGVAWDYEPRTFPILWNTDGKVIESFSPDFYLPELDLYVELTTLKQSLVRRKNRKLRRLRELYPDIKVKLFYGKDFRALMLKYGRFDLAASLSGLEGQITPLSVGQPKLPVTVPAAAAGERRSSGRRRVRGCAASSRPRAINPVPTARFAWLASSPRTARVSGRTQQLIGGDHEHQE